MSDVWYFAETGAPRGPYARDDIDAFVAAGRVRRDTLVWTPAMANWTAAAEAGLFAATLPPEGPPHPPHPPHPRRDAPFVAPPAAALPGAGPSEALARYFTNYAVFEGRASRAEFGWTAVLLGAMSIGAGFVDTVLAFVGMFGVATSLLFLLTLVPSVTLIARRLHDLDRSGWWLVTLFVPILNLFVLFVLFTVRGSRGTNRYGTTS